MSNIVLYNMKTAESGGWKAREERDAVIKMKRNKSNRNSKEIGTKITKVMKKHR